MSKKVLIISASLRIHSNSEALADSFAEGVNAAGEIEGHPALKKAYDMGASI